MSDDARTDGSLLEAAPGLTRIAVGVAWRTAGWTATAYARAWARLMRAALSGESPAQLLSDVGGELREQLRLLLGVVTEAQDAASGPNGAGPSSGEAGNSSLRARGEELLRRSADVRYEEHAHPAYDRILDSLAPDEARILRLLALEGPQPSVDVRTSKTLNVTSQLVAPGLSMIGAQAGCRFMERVPAYLNNLYRLGLIWFSREPLEDPLRYQVLEAQPDVGAAMRGSGRGRTVRRSVHLTPFGEDFCATVLPLHTGEIDALGVKPGGAGA